MRPKVMSVPPTSEPMTTPLRAPAVNFPLTGAIVGLGVLIVVDEVTEDGVTEDGVSEDRVTNLDKDGKVRF